MNTLAIQNTMMFTADRAAQRERDHAALAMMKRLEAERKDKMRLLRVDAHTTVAATSERLKDIKRHHKIKT